MSMKDLKPKNLHPEAEKFIDQLLDDNTSLQCTMLNDMVFYSELDAQTKLEMKFCIMLRPNYFNQINHFTKVWTQHSITH